jgi:hypothetical protein
MIDKIFLEITQNNKITYVVKKQEPARINSFAGLG